MKDLVILVCYLNTDGISEERAFEQYEDIKAGFHRQFCSELEEETNTAVRFIVVPVKNQDTHIECIYPKNIDEDVIKKLDEIELHKSFVDNILKNEKSF